MEHNAKSICRTLISSKEKKVKKQTAEFLEFPYFLQYFIYILVKFNTFSRSWKPISQFNTFNTVWEPCQHPIMRVLDSNKSLCCHHSPSYSIPGLHNSESSMDQIININSPRPQESI